jgi:hypothetical protein
LGYRDLVHRQINLFPEDEGAAPVRDHFELGEDRARWKYCDRLHRRSTGQHRGRYSSCDGFVDLPNRAYQLLVETAAAFAEAGWGRAPGIVSGSAVCRGIDPATTRLCDPSEAASLWVDGGASRFGSGEDYFGTEIKPRFAGPRSPSPRRACCRSRCEDLRAVELGRRRLDRRVNHIMLDRCSSDHVLRGCFCWAGHRMSAPFHECLPTPKECVSGEAAIDVRPAFGRERPRLTRSGWRGRGAFGAGRGNRWLCRSDLFLLDGPMMPNAVPDAPVIPNNVTRRFSLFFVKPRRLGWRRRLRGSDRWWCRWRRWRWRWR